MDLRDPNNSRVLAILIQDLAFDSKVQFLEDAEEAPDMETFMRGMGKYKLANQRDK